MTKYLIILTFKILENALSTLRIIIISNGKKILGAILQGIIALVWIFSTSLVVIDIKKDPIKIIFFIIGSIVGSYIGSVIEEKIAMGSNMITAIVNINKTEKIVKALKKQKYEVNIIKGKNDNELNRILIIITKRKTKNNVIKLIKNIDKNATIIIENAYQLDYLSK
ncbi:MAG: hypothetical protein J6D28_00795 [Bacilli bacterium]|nr:hypothetical protein [Bacilli bacterium]